MQLQVWLPIVFGAVLVAAGIYGYKKKKRLMANAVPVEAEVLDTRVEKHRTPDVDDPGDNVKYSPIVRYEYYVDGVKYQSNSLQPGADSKKPTQASAEKVVEQYEPGETIEVYVDPDDPDSAYIEEVTAWKVLIISVIGALFLAAGIINFL